MLNKKQLALISIGTSLSFWDIFNVPYIVNAVSKTMGLSSSLILSAEMLGYFIGGGVNGYVASVKGRKLGIILSMAFIVLGSFIGFLSNSFEELFIAEFIIGLGVEGEITTVPVYVSEMSDRYNRGKSVGFATLGGFLISLVVGPFAVILKDNWRFLFLPGLIIAIFALVVRLKLPESRLWILNKGKGNTSFFKKLNRNTIIFLVIWFTSYFCGYSLFSSPIFSLISSKGFVNTSLYFTYMLYGDPLGVVVGSLINDKIERKYSSFMANFVSGILVVLMPTLSGIPFIVIGFLIMFFQGFKFPAMYTYTAENFQTEIRSLSYGIADGMGHLGGAIGPVVFTLIYSTNSLASFLLLGIVSMLSGTIIVVKGMRTKGKSLEEIEVELLKSK